MILFFLLQLAINSKVTLVGLKSEEMNGLSGTIVEGPIFYQGVEKYIVEIHDGPQVAKLSGSTLS